MKHKITLEQAREAHNKGVEVFTTYAIDRTPGRALSAKEAWFHQEIGLPLRTKHTSAYTYRQYVPEAPAEPEMLTGVEGLKAALEKPEEWECNLEGVVWLHSGQWRHAAYRRLSGSGCEWRRVKREPIELTGTVKVNLDGTVQLMPIPVEAVGKRFRGTLTEVVEP